MKKKKIIKTTGWQSHVRIGIYKIVLSYSPLMLFENRNVVNHVSWQDVLYAVSCATCNGLLLIILFDYTVRPRQTAYPFKIRKNDRKNYRQNIISKTRRKIPKTILYLDVRTNNYFNPTVNGRRKGFTNTYEYYYRGLMKIPSKIDSHTVVECLALYGYGTIEPLIIIINLAMKLYGAIFYIIKYV